MTSIIPIVEDDLMIYHFNVPDDSGFLALVDPDSYVSFVDDDWTYDQLIHHFLDQMRHHHMLLWSTGEEGMWQVQVHVEHRVHEGTDALLGPVYVSHGRLLVTNYESLTMAAQYRDVALPEPHQQELIVHVPPGPYQCRILRLHNPEQDRKHDEQLLDQHFVIELVPTDTLPAPWIRIP